MGGEHPLRTMLHERLPGCGESLALREPAVDGPAGTRISGIMAQEFFGLRELLSRY
jgi:hypothetical protein